MLHTRLNNQFIVFHRYFLKPQLNNRHDDIFVFVLQGNYVYANIGTPMLSWFNKAIKVTYNLDNELRFGMTIRGQVDWIYYIEEDFNQNSNILCGAN